MFGFSFDRRTLYIIIGILLAFTIFQFISSPERLYSLLLSAPGVLVAITFHEFAHGLAAYKLGDNTAKDEGRLSLNPKDHLDPIGTLMLLVAGFGWGKPVHVDPRNYTRKMSMEKGEAIVSAAGPIMNIILAFIFILIYCVMARFVPVNTVTYVTSQVVFAAATINIGLGIFNLIPLPPLDGSKIIKPFLPTNAKIWFENNEQIFYIVFIVIWISGIASTIISPVISAVTNGIFSLGKLIVGI